MQHWSILVDQDCEPRPAPRDHHAAVCLGFGGGHPQLLVTGGRQNDQEDFDAWLLDIESKKWREVKICEWEYC